ncbi:hypothetical protein TBLA_0F04040 [Henningerozyma blattae CBS 6284]|uniref:Ribosomal protein L9 domain-containing protein n=1 Tax=Henningerozyma blattae (strain ATCC 34711 / CBS 6284 / DSM 70876 / NBRC 10599 / NRRL Y-10934 / UCD 77-7) TaxID=1071380 RepID=I2H6D5_HENB6|nr:hypothetical protein TBLA_0F04040 [Tetrapisispora blattae CBS 6284]CCH61937.1 hypothetical protein TBLA_0F04040 [Tetrapisispora blattae CBS 6284]
MFKPTHINYSVLSKRTKRVTVQLLRDFPNFQFYEGQVIKVKPSVMINYLHRGNGARYILKDSDIDTSLLKYSQDQENLRQLAKQKSIEQEQRSIMMQQQDELKKVQMAKEKSKILTRRIGLKDVSIPGLNI